MQRKITPAERFRQELMGAVAGPQESFSGYCRLAAQAMLQTAMEIEATEFIGRSSYQRRQDDQGLYRNGYKRRRVATGEGSIALHVPQTRDGLQPFQTRILEAYRRRSETLEALIPQLYVKGLAHPHEVIDVRIRGAGGGRKPLTPTDPGLRQTLDALVDPVTRGRPESPLRWTCQSTRQVAAELRRQNHPVTDRTVAALLKQAGYSLQANRKTREGSSPADRNAQFEYLNRQVIACQKQRRPVVLVDTKKKEWVGEFKSAGQEWQPRGHPETVKGHDFPDQQLGKAIPHGVYDLDSNEGWVSVGIDHDTAPFAAASIRRWWQEMGCRRFPRATRLMITADGGGSNSSRSRRWKVALQDLANDLDMELQVCHFPPGTSKWNKIEHRLFCFITKNWRGRPLTSYETIVNLISSTTTKSGLTVRAAPSRLRASLDTNQYETGIEVSDEELARINCTPAAFRGEWNYTIRPRK